MVNSAAFNRKDYEDACGRISLLINSEGMDSLKRYYDISSFGSFQGMGKFSALTVLFEQIAGSQATPFILILELYHVSIRSIIKSLNPGDGNDKFSSSDYLLISDGLISYIFRQEYLHLYDGLGHDALENCFKNAGMIHKRFFCLDPEKSVSPEKLLLDFMTAKLLIILSGLLSVRKESIKSFIQHYEGLNYESPDIEIINEIYEYLNKSGIIQNKKGGLLCKEF